MTHTKKEEARRAIVLFGEVLAENAELRARVADLEELAANTQGLCEARPGLREYRQERVSKSRRG